MMESWRVEDTFRARCSNPPLLQFEYFHARDQ